MTLGEGKRKVYELMDEYSSGGEITEDEDIEKKMADFFDIAQKHVAQFRRIRRTYAVPRGDNAASSPEGGGGGDTSGASTESGQTSGGTDTSASSPAGGGSGITEYAMPSDFLKLIVVWRDGTPTRRYRWKAGKLIVPDSDTAETVEVEYFAVPKTIGPDTEDSYEFEVSEEAANALPFFVASQQLITDLVIDYGGLYQIYNNLLAQLAALEAEDAAGSGGELVNTLFRG